MDVEMQKSNVRSKVGLQNKLLEKALDFKISKRILCISAIPKRESLDFRDFQMDSLDVQTF